MKEELVMPAVGDVFWSKAERRSAERNPTRIGRFDVTDVITKPGGIVDVLGVLVTDDGPRAKRVRVDVFVKAYRRIVEAS